jgi:hypothetical protein
MYARTYNDYKGNDYEYHNGESMKIDKVRLSPVKGRNQVVITFNKELLKDSDFIVGEYVVIICDKNKMTIAKEDQINVGI